MSEQALITAKLQQWISKQSRGQLENIAYELIDHLMNIEEINFHHDAKEGEIDAPYWDSCGIVIGEDQ